MVLMDSYSSHVAPNALKFGKEKASFFKPFQATRPLAATFYVGIYVSMKVFWWSRVLDHLKKKGYKPTRKDFLPMFREVCLDALTGRNITNAFLKTGIFFLSLAMPSEKKNCKFLRFMHPLKVKTNPGTRNLLIAKSLLFTLFWQFSRLWG